MRQGVALLFAVLLGLPIWFMGVTAPLPPNMIHTWEAVTISLLAHVGGFYIAGWVVGFAVQKMRHG